MSLPTYKGKKEADKQKLRGGYYTPLKLADYLVKWALRNKAEKILEPSAGDGNFLVAVLKHCFEENGRQKTQVTAIEIEPEEMDKAQKRLAELSGSGVNVNWITGDFFNVYTTLIWQNRYDAIIGNPPFIRFQNFDDVSREVAFKHLKQAGYKPTKLANIWAAFVQLCIELLEDGGRMALVVPAELLQVNYAKELRTRLSRMFDHIVIIGFKKLIFPEIQQEVVLLLAEGKRPIAGSLSDIHTIEFEDGEELLQSGDLNNAIAHVPSKHSRNGMKWTSLFLSKSAFEALDEAEQSPKLIPLGHYVNVDVGVVTGRNSFFVLTEQQRDKLEAQRFTLPIIGRTSALSSIIFGPDDFKVFKASNPAYILDLNTIAEDSIPQPILEYIQDGEREDVHKGYKCRIRQRWFDVPSIFIPDAFLFRQIHKFPLLVVNSARVVSTDTIHRVSFRVDFNLKLLAATAFNSLTLAWSEVCGRSYGGGVLELEPKEAEELPIPYDSTLSISPEKVDTLLRQGKEMEALEYVDNIVLKEYLGFNNLMIKNIRCAWEELRDRRINRK